MTIIETNLYLELDRYAEAVANAFNSVERRDFYDLWRETYNQIKAIKAQVAA